MSVFNDWLVNPFSNLNNSPQTIIQTSPATYTNYLQILSIVVCNRIGEPIRFNLKRVRNYNGSDSTNFIINQFEIDPYDSKNVVGHLGEAILLLQYNASSPAIYDSFIGFSNGYSQIFDCEVNFITLNDLPTLQG